MGHYATIQDVLTLLPTSFGPIQPDRLEEFVDEAEQYVDSELALRVALPISEATHPEWFDLAQKITVRRAAAAYLRWEGQQLGTEDRLWFANLLSGEAREWIERLKTPLTPANAPAASSEYLLCPSDGGGEARDSNAVFQNSQITPGNSNHW